MRTLLSDPPPPEIEQLLAERARLGLDRRDEIWGGVLHMAPAALRRHADLQAQVIAILHAPARASGLRAVGEFNLGDKGNYQIPDAALLAPGPDQLYVPTAALVAESLSPDDETPEKIPFYAAHHVDELLIVDPAQHAVHWLALDEHGEYQAIEHSGLIDLGPARLAEQLDWP